MNKYEYIPEGFEQGRKGMFRLFDTSGYTICGANNPIPCVIVTDGEWYYLLHNEEKCNGTKPPEFETNYERQYGMAYSWIWSGDNYAEFIKWGWGDCPDKTLGADSIELLLV